MAMTWFACDFMTARIKPMRLPLVVRQASYSLAGGSFDATLDMRDSSYTTADLRAMWDAVAPGVSSVAAVRENLSTTEGGPTQDAAMGEWWITGRKGRYRSGLVQITGVCLPSYLQHVQFAQNWRYVAIDPLGRAQEAIKAAFYSGQANSATGQGVVLTPGTDLSSPKRVATSWTAGSLTYWDAVEELSSAGFEWTIAPGLVTESGVPVRMSRLLRIQEPVLRTTRDGIVLRAAAPGTEPGVILDFDYDQQVAPNDLWILGAGSGDSQIVGRAELDRPTGVPRISAGTTSRDTVSRADLNRRALAELRSLRHDDRVFEATADMEMLPGGGPRIGYSHPWEVDPAPGFPLGETGRVRVVGWSWSTPPAGQRETATLQLVRE